MTRPQHLTLCLSVLMLIACQKPAPLTGQTTPANDPNISMGQALRPGSKGQRLELLEGEMLIPAGTHYFLIQSLQTAPQQPSVVNGLQLEQLESLVARVNGENIDFELLQLKEDTQGDLLVRYRLKNVPVTEDNALIEFESPSGAFRMQALVPRIAPDMQRLEQRLDLDSTAMVEAVTFANLPLRGFSQEEIDGLKQAGFVQQVRHVVHTHFVAPPRPHPPPHFNANRQKYPPPQADPDFQRYTQARQACQRVPHNCLRPPLPPGHPKK